MKASEEGKSTGILAESRCKQVGTGKTHLAAAITLRLIVNCQVKNILNNLTMLIC